MGWTYPGFLLSIKIWCGRVVFFFGRVATNKEVREKVTIELGFVNSKLEVLKADLAQLNSSVKTYQNEKYVTRYISIRMMCVCAGMRACVSTKK